MKHIVILLTLILLASLAVPSVLAESWDLIDSFTALRARAYQYLAWKQATLFETILVAYDEEYGSHEFYKITPYLLIPQTATQQITWQMARALYWWKKDFGGHMVYYVVKMTTWDSDDTPKCLSDMLFEAIDEIGFKSGNYFDGVKVTTLVAFTAQNTTSNSMGVAFAGQKAVMVRHTYEMFDDNVVSHELGHIWDTNPPADTEHGRCRMSYTCEYMWFYNEPLQPFYSTPATFAMFQTQRWAIWAYEWCTECHDIMVGNMKEAMCGSSESIEVTINIADPPIFYPKESLSRKRLTQT